MKALKRYSIHTNITSKYIFNICVVIIMAYCSHNILTYFLGHYYYLSNYDIKKNTYNNSSIRNIVRKNTLSSNAQYKTFDEERFLTTGTWSKEKDFSVNTKLGPIPQGKPISIYSGTTLESYLARYDTYKVYRKEYEPQFRLFEDYWGNVKKVEEYKEVINEYDEKRPVYLNYKWEYRIYTFDISDKVHFWEKEDSLYSKCLADINNQYKQNYNGESHYTSITGCKAFVYKTFDKNEIKRAILFCNKRAYLVEISSIRNIDDCCNKIYATLNFKDFGINQKDKNTLFKNYLGIIVCVIVFLTVDLFYKKRTTLKNINAFKLYKVSIFTTLINITIAVLYAYFQFTEYYYPSCISAIMFLCSLGSVIGGVYMSSYLLSKSYEEYNFEYIFPSFIQAFFKKRSSDIVEKKCAIVFIGYPCLFIGIIPLGLLSLIYIFPMVILSFLCIEIRDLYNWIFCQNRPDVESNDNEIFKDYYSILDINENAKQNEIDNAFNNCMARYNNDFKKAIYGESYKKNIIEAYRVLSSAERIRPLYDQEYKIYKNSSK